MAMATHETQTQLTMIFIRMVSWHTALVKDTCHGSLPCTTSMN
jgi:hypothetical protein